jgi:hypothetical protein
LQVKHENTAAKQPELDQVIKDQAYIPLLVVNTLQQILT